MSTHLVLVSGVERDLGYFGAFFSHFLDRSAAQLDALEKSRLGGVASHVPLEEEEEEEEGVSDEKNDIFT